MAFNFGGTTNSGSSGFSFGSTTAAPSTGFGAAAAKPTSLPAFGASTAAPAFGAPASAAPPAFGAPASAAPPAFGAPASAAPPAFGAANTSTGGLSLNFGAPASTAPTLGGFGAAASTAPTLGGFGAAASTASTLGGFGAAASTAPTLGGFGAAASTAPTLGGFGATASTAPTLGGFGAAASTAPTLGGFGAAGSTAPTLGGFGTTSVAGVGGTGLGLSAAPVISTVTGLGGSTTAPSPGLGGQVPQLNQAASSKVEPKNSKDQTIPGELNTTVDDLRKFIKEERAVSTDISHVSEKMYTKIKEETDALSQLVTLLATGIQKNRLVLEKLKLSSAQELLNMEIAQRTKETPPSMQYENVAPMDYFLNLVTTFETDMTDYRKQIDETHQYLQTMGSGERVTSSDIVQAVHRLHSAFTDLAARYQCIHQTLARCKQQYISVHRRVHGTASVPGFQTKPVPSAKAGPALPLLSGPSPFSSPSDPLILARAALPNKPQLNAGMGPPTLGLNTSAAPAGAFGSFSTNTSFGAKPTGFGANTSTFGLNTTGTPNLFGNTTGFGGNTSAFGGNTSAFGGNTSAFGGNTSAFGGNTSAFGGNTSGLGTSFSSPPSGSKRNKI